MVNVGPDVGTFMRQRNLGLLLARIGFGDDPHPSHVEATREMLAACGKTTTREAVSALLHLDLTEGLPELQVPTLVVVGTADALTPPRDARRIAELVPGARLVEYPGGGHMLMYERTDEVDALIMDFARSADERMSGGRRRGRHRPRLRADVITDVPGVLAGHWTGTATGVTVVVFPPETVGSVEIRGGAPATRETAVLDPFASVEHVDAIVLTGGSAFGLAAADGVMRALAEQGRGSRRAGVRCRSSPRRRSSTSWSRATNVPGADEGRAALAAALATPSGPDAPPLAHRARRRRPGCERRQVARRRTRHHRRDRDRVGARR